MSQRLQALPDNWEAWIGPGETLLWQGAPQPDNRIRLSQILFAMLGLPFLLAGVASAVSGLSAFGSMRSVSDFGLGLFLACFSVPFLGAGLAALCGPHLATRLAHKRVRYGITDHRIYIATRWWQPKLTTHAIRPEATLNYSADGPVGTVSLEITRRRDSDGDAVVTSAKLEGLADAPEVYRLLQRIQKGMQ